MARLHRRVESSQRQVRLVGLSATLPNYEDVPTLLRVDKRRGLFFFGPEHRPVPFQWSRCSATAPSRYSAGQQSWWGINIPAHTVVIEGTDVYMPEKDTIVDDMQQIFGQPGRPQFDMLGDATLITSQDSMMRYLNKLVRATPTK